MINGHLNHLISLTKAVTNQTEILVRQKEFIISINRAHPTPS